MDYKKKYKKALQRARIWKYKSGMPKDKQGILDDIFSELKESEDEKIRKALLEMVRDTTGDELWVDYNVHKEEALAWLEKQGSQILANSAKTCKEIPNELEECEIEHGKYYYCIKDYYAGGNKRASKGDIVQALNGMSMMALGVKANEYFMPVNNIEQKIADKCEGCNNAKGCVACVDGSEWAHIDEKNSVAWSEEDEIGLDDALWCCKQAASVAKDENDMGNVWYAEEWLKSLKDRVQSQPKQEWSEEDESIALGIESLVSCASLLNIAPDRLDTIRDWLKSLKERYTWKPSDEQINALDSTLQYSLISHNSYKHLNSLFNDLKKLMEK